MHPRARNSSAQEKEQAQSLKGLPKQWGVGGVRKREPRGKTQLLRSEEAILFITEERKQ